MKKMPQPRKRTRLERTIRPLRSIVVLLYLGLSTHAIQAGVFPDFSPLHIRYDLNGLIVEQNPGFEYGSHRSGLGWQAFTYSNFHISEKDTNRIFGVSTDGGLYYRWNDIGIPQIGWDITLKLQFTLGFGAPGTLPDRGQFLTDKSRHTFSYYYIAYTAQDGTSQPSGGFYYSFSSESLLFKLRYENDWYSLLFTDQYRTAAAEALLLRVRTNQFYGAATGFSLWTGETNGLAIEADKYFPMAGQRGSAYSHGILYITGIWNIFSLSVGWDSEEIRDFIQNGYHRMRNLGDIKHIPGRGDKVFLQLSVNRFSTLY